EQVIELVAGQLLLIGHRGPLVGDVVRQRSLRDAFQYGEAEFANKPLSAMRTSSAATSKSRPGSGLLAGVRCTTIICIDYCNLLHLQRISSKTRFLVVPYRRLFGRTARDCSKSHADPRAYPFRTRQGLEICHANSAVF